MADEPTNEPPAEPGPLSPRSSSATASADTQPTIATTFHKFAFLPEEIRRAIWHQACIPTKMRSLQLPYSSWLPHVGQLRDPADAPDFNTHGIRDELTALIASSKTQPQVWSVPGFRKFRSFYWCSDSNRLGAVCPESRDVYLKLASHIRESRVKIQEGVHVSDSLDVFHFTGGGPHLTTFLLMMRPRLCPLKLAIEIGIGRREPNFVLVDEGKKAQHKLPRWLLRAIEWGREAKKGYGNSPATSLTPSIEDVMIDLQNLQAVFLIDNGIKLQRTASGRPLQANSRPAANQYNALVHGKDRRFFALSPGNEEIMKNWDVPEHVWPVLEETKRIIASSDDWKVNIYLMASVRQKSR